MPYLHQMFEDELMDEETYKTIYDFITLDNFRSGEYEGNRFLFRKIDRTYVQVEDLVAFENTGKRQIQGFQANHLAAELEHYWKVRKDS
ncbi:hypothetical protein CQS04_12250 [Chryseomicrobium excrementi]|uniref:Uncharacterized protein n=1 Tax=Chryseomicrobium excrementi TaxID=2041346 RepID=A0A2M9EXT1_9BACL|nr:hypothetical protein [Chryseomicrobium excrementi]PJK15998.1 hypothetical protein CQS04_12250 [Chryseomicrobium excrementi]